MGARVHCIPHNYNYADGRHVTGGDVFWASVDAVSTATLLYGPIVNGFKTVGGKLGQETIALATKEGISQTERDWPNRSSVVQKRNLASL